MFDYSLLEALAAVARHGSFEKAAAVLNVTSSAISQRIKLLEERSGSVLIVRGKPCRVTPAGRLLTRHVESVLLLERSLQSDLHEATASTTLRLAINADSLATWFMPAMKASPGLLFDLLLDDQAQTASWLRSGEVQAAVTELGEAVQGCNSQALGVMRYVATASPAYMQRWFAGGVNEAAIRCAPTITFSHHDQLQTGWVRAQFGKTISPPTHWLPSTQAFVDGSVAGLGWGLNPINLVASELQSGELVELLPGCHLDVPLYWQWNRIVNDALQPLTQAVLHSAADNLLPIS